MDWESLCKLEPRLIELLTFAQKIRRNHPKKYSPDSVWYHQFKPRMSDLVGFSAAGEGAIKTSEAYDIAYAKIYDALRNDPSSSSCII